MAGLTALHFWVTEVSRNANAFGDVSGCVAESVHAAHLRAAGGDASLGLAFAKVAVGAVVIGHTLRRFRFDQAFSVRRQLVSVFDWADAASALIDDEPSFERTHAASRLVDLVAFFGSAHFALAVNVDCGAWSAHTIAVNISDESFLDATQFNCKAKMED